MVLNEYDLVKVVDELRLKGYADNFIIKDNLIFSTGLNQGFGEDDVIVEGAYQFDISEEAFDRQNLFAVYIPQNELRGLIVDLLGMYFYMEDQTITKILRKVPLVTYIFDDHDPYVKYGLKKLPHLILIWTVTDTFYGLDFLIFLHVLQELLSRCWDLMNERNSMSGFLPAS